MEKVSGLGSAGGMEVGRNGIPGRDWSPSYLKLLTGRVNCKLAAWRGTASGYLLLSEYPKSGGNWLGGMLGDCIGLRFASAPTLPVFRPAILFNHWEHRASFPQTCYVYRDGRDVMVSLYFYLRTLAMSVRAGGRLWSASAMRTRRLTEHALLERDPARALPAFIERELHAPVASHRPWHEHIEEWMTHERLATVRYEDLLSEPHAALRRTVASLGWDVDDGTIARAVDHHSFSRSSGRRVGDEDRGSYFRKGVAGDWKNYFSREAAEAFDRIAGPTLIALGYAADSAWVQTCPSLDSLKPTE